MDITNTIKRKKIINLIISILVIAVCLVDFIVNMNTYYMVLNKNYQKINTINDINSKSKYFSVNMKSSTKSNYNLSGSDIIANIYTLEVDNEKLLIILKENTILTDKTEVEIMNDNIVIELKDKFEKDNYKYILTNIDFNNDIKIDTFKIYFLLAVICIFILSIIINLIGIINPKATHMYKKYNL